MRFFKGIKKRLTDKTWYYSIKKSRELYKKEPCDFYKNQIRLNIKSFLGIKPSYGCLVCEKIKEVPSVAYHITDRKNLKTIEKEGLRNVKNNIIFLLYNKGQDAKNFIKNKGIKNPVCLEINVAKMKDDGIDFFFDTNRPYFLCVTSVSPIYIKKKE